MKHDNNNTTDTTATIFADDVPAFPTDNAQAGSWGGVVAQFVALVGGYLHACVAVGAQFLTVDLEWYKRTGFTCGASLVDADALVRLPNRPTLDPKAERSRGFDAGNFDAAYSSPNFDESATDGKSVPFVIGYMLGFFSSYELLEVPFVYRAQVAEFRTTYGEFADADEPVRVRTGVRVIDDGEVAYRWAVVPRSRLTATDAEEVADEAVDFAVERLGFASGAYYGGPGRSFVNEAFARVGRSRVIVYQRSGLDI